jgi:predicted phage terminase large subunit-like protein
MKTLPDGPCRRIRYWDRASTALLTDGSGKRQNDPDWTVGVRLAVYGNPPAKGQPDSRKWIIEDVVRLRGAPSEVQSQIWRTAHADGTSTIICLEMDPGSAGKFEIEHYKRVLRGFAVRSVRPTGDKETRAAPASSASAGGAFAILGQEHSKPTWYKPFFDTLESFPKGKHDDDVDALSGAFNASFNINVSRGTVSNYRGI